MKRQYLVGAIFLGIAACAAPAPEKSQANTVAASDAMAVSGVAVDTGVDDDALVCKKVPQTGSMMKKKVCLPAAEWERAEKSAQEYMEKKRSDDARGVR